MMHHTKLQALCLAVPDKKIFKLPLYKPICKYVTPRVGPMEQTLQRSSGWCNIPNIKALCLVVQDKKISSCFSI